MEEAPPSADRRTISQRMNMNQLVLEEVGVPSRRLVVASSLVLVLDVLFSVLLVVATLSSREAMSEILGGSRLATPIVTGWFLSLPSSAYLLTAGLFVLILVSKEFLIKDGRVTLAANVRAFVYSGIAVSMAGLFVYVPFFGIAAQL